MTIDEAIKELGIINHDGFIVTRYSEFEALKLGIEALLRVIDSRREDPLYPDTLLPGETEE